jgi:predicted MFS family arabinose efflux permease
LEKNIGVFEKEFTSVKIFRAVIKKIFISLRTRNFRLYFTGQLISNIGNWLTNVAMILLVLQITHSGLDVGLLAVTVGFGWCFAIDAASYIAVLIGILMMREGELFRREHKQEGERGSGDVREGIRYIFSERTLWINFVMLALIGTLAYNFTVTLPLFVTDSLHSSDVVFTILYSVFSFGAVVCALLVAQRNLVKMKHIVLGAAAMGIAMLMLAFSFNIPVALVAGFFVGASSILYMTSTTAIIQIEAKHEMHGRILALQAVFIAGTTVIGGPLSGWIADIAGARVPLVFGALVCLAAAGFGWVAGKRDVIAVVKT